jgi:hypothetical protein
MSLVSQVSSLATRVATECKTIYGKIAGNSSGDLSGLTTTNKGSLLAAVNEVNAALDDKIDSSAIGANGGVAPLDGGGKVPSANLPSYVDDVLEFDTADDFPDPGETSKIYVAKDTNHIYRYSGSAYIDMTSASGGVASFNARTGAVVPASGDYDAFYFTETEIGDITTNFVTVFEAALE